MNRRRASTTGGISWPEVGSRLQRYAHQAQRPLHALLLLAPLIVLYELGAWSARAHGGNWELVAPGAIAGVLAWFGLPGLWVPPLAFFAILLIWHRRRRDTWRVQGWVLPSMAAEALLWALPLLALSMIFGRGGRPWAGSLAERALIAVGAGVYEELVFRMLLIAGLTWLLREVVGLRPRALPWTAGAVAAVIFAACHFEPIGSETTSWGGFWFRTIAGAYLGALYLNRGLGIAGAAHAIYNLVLVLARG